MVYLYCLLTAGGEPPPVTVRGIGGAAVRTVEAGSVRAWVSDIPDEPLAPTVEEVRAHDAVVQAALAVETPLPARFGQVIAGDEALRAMLQRRGAEMRSALERVAGSAEMTVRLLLALPDAAAVERSAPEASGASGPRATGGARDVVAPGRAYLDGVRARLARADAFTDQAGFLHERVAAATAGLATSEWREPIEPGSRLLTLAHLVPKAALPAYRQALRACFAAPPPLRGMITGPWAPYSFSRLSNG